MNSDNITKHDSYPVEEGTTFTFIVYGCDAEGFSGLRDWAKSHPLDYVLFGYTDDKFSLPQNIRGYYAMETSSSLSAFQNNLISAIYTRGGLYSRIGCEMDKLDYEIASPWCRQLPHTCEIGTRPRSWSNDLSTDFQQISDVSTVQPAMESIENSDNEKNRRFTFNCAWCNDCDIDLNINR